MKKILYFVMICFYALGVIGGFGYSLFNGAYLIAIGVAAVGYMAYPELKKYINLMMKNEDEQPS